MIFQWNGGREYFINLCVICLIVSFNLIIRICVVICLVYFKICDVITLFDIVISIENFHYHGSLMKIYSMSLNVIIICIIYLVTSYYRGICIEEREGIL